MCLKGHEWFQFNFVLLEFVKNNKDIKCKFIDFFIGSCEALIDIINNYFDIVWLLALSFWMHHVKYTMSTLSNSNSE